MAEPDRADDIKKSISRYLSTRTPAACPAEEALADYLQQRLRPEARDKVERHLAVCDRCAQTLLAAADVLEEAGASGTEPVPQHVLANLLSSIPAGRRSLFGRLRQTLRERAGVFAEQVAGLTALGQPAAAPVRGRKKVVSKNLIVLEKVFKTIKLAIEIEKTGPGCADIKVVATRPGSGARFPGVRIDIRQGSRELASFVAVRGEAVFEKIAFGSYRLIARHATRKLGEVRLAIKE